MKNLKGMLQQLVLMPEVRQYVLVGKMSQTSFTQKALHIQQTLSSIPLPSSAKTLKKGIEILLICHSLNFLLKLAGIERCEGFHVRLRAFTITR